MVELRNARFQYTNQNVLRDVSLEISGPGLVCLVGPNGSGKTTLLKLIAGILAPDAGKVSIAGKHPSESPRRETALKLSYMPQQYQVVFPFSVLEIVEMGRYPHGGDARRATGKQIIETAMERCDVSHLAERTFHQLSGGEQRRVLLAQAFSQQCPLLLLDEPTANLDPAHAIRVFQTLSAHSKETGAAVIVVTHDLNLATRYADRIVVLKSGVVTADGVVDQILKNKSIEEAFDVGLHSSTIPGTDIQFTIPGALL